MSIINSVLLHNAHYLIINRENTDVFRYHKSSNGTSHRGRYSLLGGNGDDSDTHGTSLTGIMRKITGRKLSIAGSSSIVTCFFSTVFLFASIAVPAVFSWYFFFFHVVFSFVLTFGLLNRFACRVMLRYTLNGKKGEFYQDLLHHLTHLSYSDRLWHVDEIAANKNPKKYGGSKHIYHRCRARVIKSRPHFITSNITIYAVAYSHHTLYFLPDCVLVKRKNRYAHYGYSDIFLYYAEKPSLERKSPPTDAQIIGQRWLHPNRDGTPDRRYRHNPRIPLMLLSELLVYFKGGFQSYLQISAVRIAFSFYSFLSRYAEVAITKRYKSGKPKKSASSGPAGGEGKEDRKTEARRDTGHKTEKDRADERKNRNNNDTHTTQQKQVNKTILTAFRTLGLLPGASAEDIKHNYRLLVKQYHPDLYIKSTALSQKYAEQKIIEINRAYEHILKWSRTS
ncbi:MAG: J domain-containing protein [Spirochaetales bacterium]|nr:J domain-containing protein [Spirochaetales bacterium]